jgi:hypothetical protein
MTSLFTMALACYSTCCLLAAVEAVELVEVVEVK